jgi:uncharacterized protein
MLRRAITSAAVIAVMVSCFFLHAAQAQGRAPGATGALPHTVDVGVTGFANKRPVVAAACLNGCPCGELGAYLRQSMAPLGYDIILCENCNRLEGPRIVSTAAFPPLLSAAEMSLGTKVRVNARIDFGITSTLILNQAVNGQGRYRGHPIKNLRLITRIEDPYYFLIAVKASSGITDLRQIAARKLPVRVLADGPSGDAVLKYYGLTKDRVVARGGSVATLIGAPDDTSFDVLVTPFASSSNNPESAFWTTASRTAKLRFLTLPKPLIAQLIRLPEMQRVTARCCLLHGFTAPIETVGWSGDDVFGRADMPDKVAYDIAKALDQNHAALKWFVRPYSYDPNQAWHDLDLPLAAGAARYFREKGYMPPPPGTTAKQ